MVWRRCKELLHVLVGPEKVPTNPLLVHEKDRSGRIEGEGAMHRVAKILGKVLADCWSSISSIFSPKQVLVVK
jgi:hypothetical protein